MIVANRYSRFELSPYVCGALFMKWMHPNGVYLSDVDAYFKREYSDSWRLLESRTLNFLFITGAIDYDSARQMLRVVK